MGCDWKWCQKAGGASGAGWRASGDFRIADPPSAAVQPHHWRGGGSDARARGESGAARECGLAIRKSPLVSHSARSPAGTTLHYTPKPRLQIPKPTFDASSDSLKFSAFPLLEIYLEFGIWNFSFPSPAPAQIFHSLGKGETDCSASATSSAAHCAVRRQKDSSQKYFSAMNFSAVSVAPDPKRVRNAG